MFNKNYKTKYDPIAIWKMRPQFLNYQKKYIKIGLFAFPKNL